jgi:hypothetical protein
MELVERDRKICRSEVIGVPTETVKGEEWICKEKLVRELSV